jgi:aminoglycoside phosphotransferase (APT) family kinase protein
MASSVSKARLAAMAAATAGHYMLECVVRPRGSDSSKPPGRPEWVTAEWLTDALCRNHPGAAVTSYALGERSPGSTMRQKLEVTYNAAGQQAGLPTLLFTKSTPTLKTRLVSGMIGTMVNEANYYEHLRPTAKAAGVEGPDALHVVAERGSYRSLLVLEDITARVDWFGSPLETYVDRNKAERIVLTLAALHGRFWDTTQTMPPWLQTAQEVQEFFNAVVPFLKQNTTGMERFRRLASPEFIRREGDVNAAFMRSVALSVRGPQTLLHQDCHIGNWYAGKDGTMGLFDFQCIASGSWALDVSYALMSALTVDDRRAWERELIELYLSRISDLGLPAPAFDAAFLAYRQQMFHGLCFWLFTLGYSKRQQQMQPDDIAEENLRRMTAAVVDLRSFESLDER